MTSVTKVLLYSIGKNTFSDIMYGTVHNEAPPPSPCTVSVMSFSLHRRANPQEQGSD